MNERPLAQLLAQQVLAQPDLRWLAPLAREFKKATDALTQIACQTDPSWGRRLAQDSCESRTVCGGIRESGPEYSGVSG